METLYFSVDSALLSELGEKLVERSYIALAELVKNSYDADATFVIIEFIRKDKESLKIDEIRIIDNGSGMDLKRVRKYWMRIATTVKQKERISSRFGRPRTGSKGIGRFACRRLGKHLMLETIGMNIKNKCKKISVEFDWKKFKTGSKVTNIPVKAHMEESDKKLTGTTLIITNVNDQWTQREFDALRRNLVTLSANVGRKRYRYEEDPGFNVEIKADGFEGGVGNIREQFLNSGWASLSGEVKKNGDIIYKLSAKKIGIKEYSRKRAFTKIPKLKFTIGILPLVKAHLRDKKVASMKNLIPTVKEWGGIFVRYNGFRVYPYGEQGNDWLEIDRDRGRRLAKPRDEEIYSLAKKVDGVIAARVLLNVLSSNQYFGWVYIDSTKTNGFIVKANREGFVATEQVIQLKKFVRTGIDWATIYYNHYLYKVWEEKALDSIIAFSKEDKKEIFSTKQEEKLALDTLENSFKLLINNVPRKNRDEIEKPIKKATKVIRAISELNNLELSQTRLAALANPILVSFSHEVRILISKLITNSNQLKDLITKIPKKHRDKLSEFMEDLEENEKYFMNLMNMIGLLVGKKKEMPIEKLLLKSRIRKAVSCFKLFTEHYNIQIEYNEIPSELMVGPIKESELLSILINMISNSIKAVLAGKKKRKIKFYVIRHSGRIKLRILDMGIGLQKKYWNEVFTPLIADPDGILYESLPKKLDNEDLIILGEGSGLGLNIIRQIVRERGGDIYFVTPPKPWSTCLEIIFNEKA